MRRRALILGGAAAWAGATARASAGDTRIAQVRVPALPAVVLTTMGGETRALERELDTPVPLVLNFVFTTCSAACSVQTALLAEVQRARSARGQPLRLASITIDPDNDTPEQLRRFAAKFGVAQGWQFYTGRFDDLLEVQKRFDVYRGSKVAHPPVLMLRRSTRAPWLRVEGFPGPSELLALIDRLPAAG